jgi:hypothetical protein
MWSSRLNFHSISSGLRYKYFQFDGRHLIFLALGYIQLYPKELHLEAGLRKCKVNRWNFHSISSGCRDTSTSGLAADILNFWIPGTSNNIESNSFGGRVLRSVGAAVGFLILLAIQAKIQQLCGYCENISVFGFEAAILDSWLAQGFTQLQCFIVQPLSGNVLKAFLLTPSGFEMAVKSTAGG